MPQRMLQRLGGLLAVAVLVVAPSAASGDAPTAKIAGNGNYDQNPPNSQWGNDWWGHDGNGGRNWQGWGDGDGYFDGSSHDNGGDGNQFGNAAKPAGKVARVMVAAKRLRGSGSCQHLSRSGSLSSPGSCASTHWMRAKGTSNWRFDIAKKLPAGRYQLQRRAVDAAGNRERPHRLHLRIR